MAKRDKETSLEFEDLSSYSSSKEYMRGRKNRRLRLAIKCVIGALCVLLIVFGSGLIYVSTDLISGLQTRAISKDELATNSNHVMDDSVKSIAVFGVDARNDVFEGQSDMIMIVTVDNKNKKLKMTSILRDSYVSIEGKGYKGGVDYYEKINAAYVEGGPELAIRTLNRNYGLQIEDYVTVNIANLATIIDAFGGVDIALTSEEIEEVNKNLWALSQEVLDQIAMDQESGVYDERNYPNISEVDYMTSGDGGTFHLNGNQAIAYGRIREIGYDMERVERQQNFVVSVLQQLLKQQLENQQVSYLELIRQIMPLCQTSMNLDDIVALTPLLTTSFQLETISVPDVDFEIWDDSPDENNARPLRYDLEAASHRIDSFLYEEDSPYWNQFGPDAKVSSGGEDSDSSNSSSQISGY